MNALVSDPTGALGDPAMPMLRLALQAGYMAWRLQDCLPLGLQLATGDEPIQLRECLYDAKLDGLRIFLERKGLALEASATRENIVTENLLEKREPEGATITFSLPDSTWWRNRISRPFTWSSMTARRTRKTPYSSVCKHMVA